GAFFVSTTLRGYAEHVTRRAFRSSPRDLPYIDVLEDQLQYLVVTPTPKRLSLKLFRLVLESGALQFSADFADNIENVAVLTDEFYCDVRFRHLLHLLSVVSPFLSTLIIL